MAWQVHPSCGWSARRSCTTSGAQAQSTRTTCQGASMCLKTTTNLRAWDTDTSRHAVRRGARDGDQVCVPAGVVEQWLVVRLPRCGARTAFCAPQNCGAGLHSERRERSTAGSPGRLPHSFSSGEVSSLSGTRVAYVKALKLQSTQGTHACNKATYNATTASLSSVWCKGGFVPGIACLRAYAWDTCRQSSLFAPVEHTHCFTVPMDTVCS